MKRITYWPQFVLGLAFSWGALIGFAAQSGQLNAAALALYGGAIAWVIFYDTIYAHQDREDDVLIGGALWLAGAGWVAFAGLAGFAAHLAWQVRTLDVDDPARCLRLFKSNRDAGLILFAGLLADAVLRAN
jgi:4-hydroxybenzoate polyprenyltransferase